MTTWTASGLVPDAEVKDKERGKDKLVEAGNIIHVNLVLVRQAKLSNKLRKHINHEVMRYHLFCLDWFLI